VNYIPIIQQTFGTAGGFDSDTRRTIKRHLREIECTNIMTYDLIKYQAAIHSGEYEGAELAELHAKTSMLIRTQIRCRNFGLQIFSDKFVLVQELEFMNKSNLEDYKMSLLKINKRLDIPQLTQVTFDLLMGMAFLHNRNIIHRDISANNVLVRVDGQNALQKVVIADFDNCRFFGSANEAVQRRNANEQFMALSKAEQMGKFHYRPPEGVHRPSMYDQKWDIFQIGIVLWSLFCDEAHPYEIDSSTLKTIQNPKDHLSLLAALWMMQTQNIGYPSAIEWKQLQSFKIPNVQINQKDEETRMRIMDQLKLVITRNSVGKENFENADYDSKKKKMRPDSVKN